MRSQEKKKKKKKAAAGFVQTNGKTLLRGAFWVVKKV